MDRTKGKLMNEKPTVICLTPVRNEGWILDRFLKAASLWADYIIIADQMSTDGSRDIAKSFPKVRLIDNSSEVYDEQARQKLLIDEARKINGPRLLITLDADEIFTPNVLTTPEWQTVLTSKPGTLFKFQWANLRPDMKNMWLASYFPWGYMDDGCEHTSNDKIHSSRIPLPSSHDTIILNQIKVIHFQFTDWERMESKHRWYQCFETIQFPKKKAIDIFRMYHHMHAIPQNQIVPIPMEWINGYNQLGIDITSVCNKAINWFDEKTIEMIGQYGATEFRKLNIWDVNWAMKSNHYEKINSEALKDPRSKFDKIILKWLIRTQKKQHNFVIRFTDKLLKIIFRY
jgi:hypothetical protein